MPWMVGRRRDQMYRQDLTVIDLDTVRQVNFVALYEAYNFLRKDLLHGSFCLSHNMTSIDQSLDILRWMDRRSLPYLCFEGFDGGGDG